MNPREKLALAKEKFGLEQGVGILMGVGSFGENYDHDPTIWSGIDSSMDGYKPVFHLDEIEESVFADLESRVISMKSTKGQGDEAVFYGATAYRHKFLPKEDFMPAFPLYAFFRAYVLDYAAEFGERKNEVFETLFPPIQAVDLEALKAGLQSEVPPKWLDIWPYVPLTVEYVTDCAEYLARYPSDDDVFLYGGIATAEQFANWQASEGLEMEGALWNEYHAGGDKLPDDVPPAPFEDETPLQIRGEDENVEMDMELTGQFREQPRDRVQSDVELDPESTTETEAESVANMLIREARNNPMLSALLEGIKKKVELTKSGVGAGSLAFDVERAMQAELEKRGYYTNRKEGGVSESNVKSLSAVIFLKATTDKKKRKVRKASAH